MEPESVGYEEVSFISKLKSKLIEAIEFIAIVGAILVVIRFFIAEPHKVSGNSMIPNFHNGDYIITNKLAVKFGTPQRGEVIILQNPRNFEQIFIKRVIGLPNDHIRISGNQVYVNNLPINEPYLPPNTITQGGTFYPENVEAVVPEGQYFVMGDNRTGSSDSREWGGVTFNKIIGQAYLRYWPFNKFGLIKIKTPSF